MPGATLVTLEQYLSSTYRPDCDFVDGEIQPRHDGTKPHSAAFAALLWALRDWPVYPSLRLRAAPNRVRVPDVCVFASVEPEDAPFLCAEILSETDAAAISKKVDDYLRFGVPYVWVIDPRTRRGWVHTPGGSREVKDGVLRTANPDLAVPLEQLFPPTPNQP